MNASVFSPRFTRCSINWIPEFAMSGIISFMILMLKWWVYWGLFSRQHEFGGVVFYAYRPILVRFL